MGFRENLENAGEQAKGEVKEQWGELTDDPETEAEGKFDKLSGGVKEKVEEVKDRFG